MSDLPAPPLRSVLDPRISLATALQAQPGVYALLLGSGTSTGAGVPTGWGVVTELVRKAAAAAKDDVPGDLDPESWWAENAGGQPLGYSALLSALAPTPAARRALLAGFFEPSDDDREQGRRVPGPAHQAIAALVARGSVRVIVTTNFDRLIEQALEAVGIMPQVIATPSAVAGMEPLTHARCTIIKLHGDYATLDQLNTVEELSTYSDEMTGLIDRVLDEYGVIVNGWSGDWDGALVRALEGTRSRRYPLYWSAYSNIGAAASHLIAQHHAQIIAGVTADQFFPDIVSRLDAIDALADPPPTLAIAISRLKRALPDPVRHIELRDLIDAQIGRIQDALAERPQTPPASDPQTLQDAHDSLRRASDTLLHLLAHGIYLDRDQQHTDLWVRTVEQLMRARRTPGGTYVQWWNNLQHYPALLALRVGVSVAVAAKHENVAIQLLHEPTWRPPFNPDSPKIALDALNEYDVLDPAFINQFPRWDGKVSAYPLSHLLKDTLRSILLPLLGDDDSYVRTFHRAEYRIALAHKLAPKAVGGFPCLASGEFISENQWYSQGRLIWEDDFRKSGDREAWGWTPVEDETTDGFSKKLTALTEELKHNRQLVRQ
jgi:hypothetical protein